MDMDMNDSAKYMGGMTSLPEGTYGNFPDKVKIVEMKEDIHRFVPPPLLSRQQLLEQLGPELNNQDPLWFLYDMRKFPCVKKFAVVGGLTFTFSSTFLYYLRRSLPTSLCLKYSAIVGSIGATLSFTHCLSQHWGVFRDVLDRRALYRGQSSYGIPEYIQREQDLQLFLQHNPQLIKQQEQLQRQQFQLMEQQRQDQSKQNASLAMQQLIGEYNELKVAQEKHV
jgi:hypothetical protein